jgi:hypothetical protein
MVVKYNRYFGWVLTLSALSVLVLNLYLYTLTGKLNLGFYSAVIILILCKGYIKGKYFIVNEQSLLVYNSLGYCVKKYYFNSLSDIYEYNLKFYFTNKSGKTQRLRISKFMSDSADWNNFIRYINRDNLSKELHDINH